MGVVLEVSWNSLVGTRAGPSGIYTHSPEEDHIMKKIGAHCNTKTLFQV